MFENENTFKFKEVQKKCLFIYELKYKKSVVCSYWNSDRLGQSRKRKENGPVMLRVNQQYRKTKDKRFWHQLRTQMIYKWSLKMEGEVSGKRVEVLFCKPHICTAVSRHIFRNRIFCPLGAQLCWLLKFSDIIKPSHSCWNG